MAGALIAFGRFGDDEGDASAVGRKLEARKMTKVEQRFGSERLSRGRGGLLGGDYAIKKKKTAKDGEKGKSPHDKSSNGGNKGL